MAKTSNKDIDIFTSLETANKAFTKTLSGDLLHAESYKAWYIDRSKTAIKEWSKLYKLLDTK